MLHCLVAVWQVMFGYMEITYGAQ